MRKANPKIRWHLSDVEKKQIREMTRKGVRQSQIARTLGIGAPSVSKAQRGMRLPTRLVIPEKKIMRLFSRGWGGYRIAKHLHVAVSAVYKVAHRNNFCRKDAVGYPTDPANEARLIEALKRRDDYAIRLARKHKVGICKTNRLAHEILDTPEFRPGLSKPALSSNFPQKHFEKMGTPDIFVQLVDRVFGNQLPFAREHDVLAVAAMLTGLMRVVPDFQGQPPAVLHHFALGLVEAIGCIRENARQSN